MSKDKIIVSAKQLADIHNQLLSTAQNGDNMIIVGNCIMSLRQILSDPEYADEDKPTEAENDKPND